MVREIKIQNYKSVQDLTLELGRINVLIGANGCGKSNILEAIAFGSAAADNKLNKEILTARGVRVTDSVWMRSGFKKKSENEPIKIKFDDNMDMILKHDNEVFSNWEASLTGGIVQNLSYDVETMIPQVLKVRNNITHGYEQEYDFRELKKISHLLNQFEIKATALNKTVTKYHNFLIFAPENTFLRKFEDDEKTIPLGIRGEGLFNLLNEMSNKTPEEFQEIIENLELIDWFDGFEIPKDLVFTERRIRIKDRFLEEGLQYFDQRRLSVFNILFCLIYFKIHAQILRNRQY